MTGKMRKGWVTLVGLGLTASAVLLSSGGRNTTTIVASVVGRVPQAKPALTFEGTGFIAAKNRSFIAAGAAVQKGAPAAQVVTVTAPPRANGSFEIGDAQGRAHGTLRLVGAAREEAHVEQGALVYPSAYPNVDVVFARDPSHLELAYVAQTTQLPPLALAVGGEETELTLDRATGAAVLRARDGKPALRADPPVAFDAAGQRREGAYVLADAHTLRIELSLEGLTPPVLIDPAFYIPFWTLDEDGRSPGNVAYDSKRQSREAQIVLNTASGKPWLIRPARSLQPRHYDELLGAERPEEWYSPISATLRVSGSNGPPANPLLAQYLQRTVGVESETYEWSDDGWHLLPHTNLPAFVDPTFAFATGRGRAVAIGGRLPAATEQNALLAASEIYENDGTGWTAKGVPGGPPPRVRAASVGFGSKIVLFGGRSLGTPGDLLNDTWTYDGYAWQKVPVSNPPPACESSQLIHDARRDRIVLVGGNCSFDSLPFNPSDTDGFRLWEFDGTDWTRRFDIDDAALPQSFRLRHGVAAAWNPVRRTTMLFGGFVDVTELCTLTPTDLATQRYQANLDIYVSGNSTRKVQLEKSGCWGGYVHDTWEWDGTTLRALTRVAYGASVADRWAYLPIFQQVAAQIPPPSAGVGNVSPATTTKLWPWRYDSRPGHFAQRSVLERSAAQPGVPNASPVTSGGQVAVAALSGPNVIISPVFAPTARPQLVVKPDGKLLVFSSDDGHVFETDLTSWTVRTPSSNPFAEGQNDFFAATFDSARQKTVLFDPATGVTWDHDNLVGWKRMQTAGSPGVWTQPPWLRLIRDVSTSSVAPTFASLPRMTYDRARASTLMLYRDSLWELNGSTWTPRTLPAALRGCQAASLITFDGVRNRTVVVGCRVPAQTWEWDGSAWLGPFASPFQDKVTRQFPSQSAYLNFKASLQLDVVHPNALFESPTLGGVGIIDGSGTLRIWKGTEWTAGASFGDPVDTDAWTNYNRNLSSGPSYNTPTAFYPPVIEDFSANRLLAFRDGIRATRELPLTPPIASAWQDAFVGTITAGGVNGVATVHPFPLELLPSDWITSQGYYDPATVVDISGNPATRTFDKSFTNLYWPFRLLPDPTTHRVRVLTDRGMFWELGSERIGARGDQCVTSQDCSGQDVCSQGACCAQACDGRCLTCNGAHPGTCEAVPAGAPDPKSTCGTGECAGVCSGNVQESNGFPASSCMYPAGRSCGSGSTCNDGQLSGSACSTTGPGVSCSNGQVTGGGTCATNGPTCVAGPPTAVACGGGLKCADDAHCKPACSSAADCQTPNQICAPDGKSCISDGKVCHNNGECPKFNDCAADGLSCKPDAVLAAATARGVTASTWQPEVSRDPEQLAAYLKTLGYPEDSQGRIVLDTLEMSSAEMRFNPKHKTPVTGFRRCMDHIDQCRFETKKLDECVAAAPRCETDTPWLDDPGGWDCCPGQCLTDYFARRATRSGGQVMVDLSDGACYPHLTEYLEAP